MTLRAKVTLCAKKPQRAKLSHRAKVSLCAKKYKLSYVISLIMTFKYLAKNSHKELNVKIF